MTPALAADGNAIMADILRRTGIAEVILLFNLLFVLPTLALLLLRVRKYEARFGPPGGKEKGEARPKAETPPPPNAERTTDGKYPYRRALFLSPPERSCLAALETALGPEAAVHPKVALWEWVEPTDKDPDYRKRLHGLALDFLVCDRRTGQALAAVMFKPAKGRPSNGLSETRKICEAAGAKLVLVEFVEDGEYDSARLKKELGIPDPDL